MAPTEKTQPATDRTSPASYRFNVCGRVQGVSFRQSTRERALALGLSGWVRNREDGSVEGAARGADEALAALRSWLDRGPPAARVDRVEWTADPAATCADCRDFEVRR